MENDTINVVNFNIDTMTYQTVVVDLFIKEQVERYFIKYPTLRNESDTVFHVLADNPKIDILKELFDKILEGYNSIKDVDKKPLIKELSKALLYFTLKGN